MSTILIYDEDVENIKVMESRLVSEGYEVRACTNVVDSLRYIENTNNQVEMLITNYNVSSFTLKDYLSVVRKFCSNISIIVMSSSDSVEEEYDSLTLNVDEFINKDTPASITLKRIKRVYEYRDKHSDKITLKRERIVINLASHQVTLDGKIISLTIKEYQLLTYMIRRKNRVVTREMILLEVWGQEGNYTNLRLIDVNISNLRKKLKLRCLSSVRGIGYRLEI